MGDWNGKTVIITGASSGIGEATAAKFAGEGANVVLAARREDRLNELKDQLGSQPGELAIKTTDVTVQQDVEDLVQFTIDTYGQVDLLLNNAGIMPLSFMKNKHVDEWEKMVDINIKGVLFGVGAVLPHMLERNTGHIMTTSSIAGHEVMPSGAVYCGTKFAARVIMEGLGKEIAGSNIRTTTISPGVVDTELTETITDEDVLEMLKKRFGQFEALQSVDIAEAIYYAANQPLNVDVNEVIVRPNNQE
ncbi:SDR family oxidoreductase [Salisediminibacterium halotolerans]|uniref:NADP-dependent 3-hydroxy acid dehydrogenase YdfG n=1 Tax=Salisediminibacterium halotolerans TaxID=517425 RepID=A0A1H9V0H8_9BACI|nr:SDR family oxidoreductase [Salisediminibacterium haloalkalitolerans]SES15172.1 NADP-dependent 3-hydroxy acid dehydrogenase YdfG [Salisediminibacterium haloalkalitolerans]